MILDDEEFIKISSLIASRGYNQNYKAFRKALFLTRIPFLKRSSWFMRGIQGRMLESLSEIQDAMRANRSKLTTAVDADKPKIERDILMQREWIRTLQTIADGIAWRMFRFDRPILMHMSDSVSPGHISQSDQNYVSVLKKYLYGLRGFPIVNDLTRVLRVADFSVVYPDHKTILYEVKEGGREIFDVGKIFYEINRSKKIPNPQKWRQLHTQMSIVERKLRILKKNGAKTNMLEVDIVDLDFKIQHHLAEVRGLIAEANKTGFASKVVEEGYYIEVTAVHRMMDPEIVKLIHSCLDTKRPDWVKKPSLRVLDLSNYDSFYQSRGRFARAFVPYSVLPLPTDSCIKLMMGHVWLKVVIDTDVLKRKLIEAGWQVTDADALDLDQLHRVNDRNSDASTTEKIKSEEYFKLQKQDERGTFTSAVPISEVLFAMSSFYGFDFIFDAVQAGYLEAKRGKRSGYTARNYLGERKVLI